MNGSLGAKAKPKVEKSRGGKSLSIPRLLLKLSEDAHLPFDKAFDRLRVLSKVNPSTSLRFDAEHVRSIEGLRYPHPSSLTGYFSWHA